MYIGLDWLRLGLLGDVRFYDFFFLWYLNIVLLYCLFFVDVFLIVFFLDIFFFNSLY